MYSSQSYSFLADMAVERELKLRIAPEQMGRLKRHPLLKQLCTVRATTRKLYSVYYDTPRLDLRRNGMALRLRRVGRQWLQTLKGGGGVQAGLHQRDEWETSVPGQALDVPALEAYGAPHLPSSLRKKLQPLFITDFTRTSYMVMYEGATIELGMDSGEIRAGRASHPISELELEIKAGEAQQLFKLALALIDIVPLEVEHISKAEYGYALYTAFPMEAFKACNPLLVRSQSIPIALCDMAGSCLQHLQANVSGVVGQQGEEYLHQVRVALRRLRVVLGMAETFHADADLTLLHEQVAALCKELGRSREWDVFVTQTLAVACAHLPKSAGLQNILCVSEGLREQHQSNVRDILRSQDYQRFLLRFGSWLNGGYCCTSFKHDFTLPNFAAQVLQRRSKQVAKCGKRLAMLLSGREGSEMLEYASELHLLRITCKKLRYSAEMFSSLYPDTKARSYLSALALLQDILGLLNDIAVARCLLGELEASVQHEAILVVRGWIEHDYTERLVELRKAWKRFSREKTFW